MAPLRELSNERRGGHRHGTRRKGERPEGSDDAWRGWWGEGPPYRAPVLVLTHHARAPLAMAGGTTFHIVTGGIGAGLARAAAGGRDVPIAGGVATVRAYPRAGLLDELPLAVAPVVPGRGAALFAGIDLPALGCRVAERAATESATHAALRR